VNSSTSSWSITASKLSLDDIHLWWTACTQLAKDALTKERKSDRRGEKHGLQDNEEIRPYFFCIER
jgi:hypothetical protein